MSKPTIYGISASRAIRSIWAIEEVGIDFEHQPVSFREDSKTPEYLAVNPNGRIPALVDGDVRLFESMAINLYLAKTYGGDLYPKDPVEEARTWQWSFWGMTELEPHLMQMVLHKVMLPEDKRKPALVEGAAREIQRPLLVLDAHLKGRDYLLGGAFGIADLNVAAVLGMAEFVGFDYSEHAEVRRWMGSSERT